MLPMSETERLALVVGIMLLSYGLGVAVQALSSIVLVVARGLG